VPVVVLVLVVQDHRLEAPCLSLFLIFSISELSMDLLSVGQITDHNCFVGFDDSSSFVQDLRIGEVIGTGRRRRAAPRLYILDTLCLPSSTTYPLVCFLLRLLPMVFKAVRRSKALDHRLDA
jgi:hypothetical protein